MEKFVYSTYRRNKKAEAALKNRSVLFIDNDVAQKVLAMDECMKVIDEAYQEMGRGYTASSRDTFHAPRPDGSGWYAWRQMSAAVTKLGVTTIRIISMVEADKDLSGHERWDVYSVMSGKYCGLILLFSNQDAAPLAMMNDGHIQHMRVAATGGLSVKYMARENASVLGIFGTAGMASTHAWAIARVRAIREIKVYSPNPEHRKAFVRDMSRFLNIKVVAMDDPRMVAQGSDIVAACTSSWLPVIKGEWLEPGTHILSVTPFELDDEVFRRVDRYAYSRTPSSEHHFATPKDRPPHYEDVDIDTAWMMREQQLLTPEKMIVFSDLALGRAVGRARPDEITCFTSLGLSVQFTAAAHRVYQLAKKRGLGRKLPLAWFIQDIHL